MNISLHALLAPYAGRLPPVRVVIASGALERLPDTLRGVLPAGRWLIVADPVTDGVAGQRVERLLAAAGLSVARLVLGTASPAAPLVANEERVQELIHRMRGGSARVSASVAVGSGTINDLVKMAAFRVGLPYAVVPTAPSMNGYTSPIAAILSRGVKTVQDARLPAAVVADVDVLTGAPARMIAAGFGDLLSRPVSNADWWLSHQLTGSAYSADVMQLAQEGCGLVAGMAARLPERDPEAVARLTGALIISGYAMTLAGTSAPASGGEHLISHYLDMTHYAFGQPADLHGCQVAVGTLVTAAFYERLLALNPGELDIEGRVAQHPPWSQYAAELHRRFGTLADAVLPHAREWYPNRAVLRARLRAFRTHWPEWRQSLGRLLRPRAALAAELAAAGCPRTFAELGVSRERARRAVVYGKDIRARYTVLHLCWEIGRLEQWAEEALEEVEKTARGS